ncbi:unnamed protein product [Allacma fusca]|uniref:Uncharacterized protein n=1 Tax=Allacma fusca TaxID=39272 RepID=A0A8J2NKU0_9HEXA|nr:unnamed protein product [Allacma fusca]
MESLISDAAGKAAAFSSEVSGRDFGLGFPIIYTIGWLFVAYLIFMFLVVYVGPALFGDGYYYERPGWGRNGVLGEPHFRHPATMRMGIGGIAGMNENDATHFTAAVTSAVGGPGTK